MKFKLQATIEFDVEIDEDVTSMDQMSEEMEMSFTVPEGCKMTATSNDFIIIQDEQV